MPRLPNGHICDFVRAVMPEGATEAQFLEAQAALDDVLDAVDRIVAERYLDTSGRRDMVRTTPDEA